MLKVVLNKVPTWLNQIGKIDKKKNIRLLILKYSSSSQSNEVQGLRPEVAESMQKMIVARCCFTFSHCSTFASPSSFSIPNIKSTRPGNVSPTQESNELGASRTCLNSHKMIDVINRPVLQKVAIIVKCRIIVYYETKLIVVIRWEVAFNRNTFETVLLYLSCNYYYKWLQLL